MKRVVVVAGAIACKPGYGGHTWALLQYVLGFRDLGWDVVLVDETDGPADSAGVRYLMDTMAQLGLAGQYALLLPGGGSVGLPRSEVRNKIAAAEFLLNIMGYLKSADLLAPAKRRVFLDIDPGFGQMWRELTLADPFANHDCFVTIGENIGADDCAIPTCGLTWITTPQPVVLAHWPALPPISDTFTSVASWRGAYAPVEYHGVTYGLRVHEFRKFVTLPGVTGRRFELALDIDPADARDRHLLETNGWTLVNPRSVAADVNAYRNYIAASGAEFMVAKNIYVRSNSGWLSDRSLCYLATGRPVIAQDTGFGVRYPTGRGLLSFSTVDEAAAAVESVGTAYDAHARAARELAAEYFDSRRVLSRLADEVLQ